MQKAVVTGGAGFIGSHLVDLLIANHYDVSVIDDFSSGNRENLHQSEDNVNVIDADISKNGSWNSVISDANYVFHLAGKADIVPSIEDPRLYFDCNVTGTLNVLLSCGKDLRKFVYAASSSCYGIPGNYPTSEDESIKPEYPYALTKNMGEQLVMHWNKVYKIPTICLRLFNVYGPRSRTAGAYGAVIGVFIAQKLAKVPLTIVGDGTQKRDFTFVSDVANAFLLAAESKYSGSCYNVGSGHCYAINLLAEIIGGDTVHIPWRPGEPEMTFADISKIKKELNFDPKVSFKEGMSIILSNLDAWRDAPVWDPSSIEKATTSWFKFLEK